MSLILDRMSSFVKQDLTHIGQYTVSRVKLSEILYKFSTNLSTFSILFSLIEWIDIIFTKNKM